MGDHEAPYTPTISPRFRTATYLACLFLTVLTVLVCTILVLAGVLDASTAAGIAGAVTTACSTISAGLGVAYRPTRTDIASDGTPLH